jgi:aspartokinase/homoserine dehydrogenase 1
MIQDLVILGATGAVGNELVKQIFEKGDTNHKKHPNPTRIVGLCSSKSMIFSNDGIEQDAAYSFKSKLIEGREHQGLDSILTKVVNRYNQKEENLIFVDVTDVGDEMTQFHKKIINDTNYGIVTANKNPLALSNMETFNILASKTHRYGFRCSVMAGAGAVQFLQESRDVNDIPTSISGCFSGTLGYICSELETGRKLSEIIQDAKDKKYTEPHPRDDLNGLDVARKLLILARTAGYDVEMSDLDVKPFIPNEYLKYTNLDEFMSALPQLNPQYENMMEKARNNENKTLRYVATLDIVNNVPKMHVGLREVESQSSLGGLNGSANRVLIVNDNYPCDNPFDLKAPGAGVEVTAQNIRTVYFLISVINLF